jgi:Asp-tRNA(Asn)/Glu-tRNA(Gln) amidotransferase A subunit family amidase
VIYSECRRRDLLGGWLVAKEELTQLTASEIVKGTLTGKFTAVEVVEACLDRIRRVDPQVNAWTVLEAQGAHEQAEWLDSLARAGHSAGILHGVPVGIKDIIDTGGVTTAYGTPIFQGRVPKVDAVSVARLKAAGAIILGKTVTTEFAAFHPGPTRNPWNVNHTPGGSSSGSAAAVACGMVPLALGTQTAGSIVRPAAYCGVVGIKPTFGRVSARGAFPLAPSMDTIGGFARSVEDAARLIQAMAGPDPNYEHSLAEPAPDLLVSVQLERLGRRPVFGTGLGFFLENADKSVLQAYERALDCIARAGGSVVEIQLPEWFPRVVEAQRALMRIEAAWVHREIFAQHGHLYSERMRSMVEEGAKAPASEYIDARELRFRWRLLVSDWLRDVDVLVTPSTPSPAPEGLGSTGDPIFNLPWTYSGHPAMNLPVGTAEGGLPVGIQLVGPFGGESRLLSVAAWCEQVAGVVAHAIAPCSG